MEAPGRPGLRPTWTSSVKDIVGTTIGPSRLWFTIGFGIVNEVYYPRVDSPQIRDLGFIVGDGRGFWVEMKRNDNYVLTTPSPGIPAVQILHRHPRFELTLRVAPDPDRDVLLIEALLTGDPDLKLYVLLAPHLGGAGYDNQADVFKSRDSTVLCAEQGSVAVALAAADARTQRDAWMRASAGIVGVSDGWQDFSQNGGMTWCYERAGPGNVALLGEAGSREIVLALGFGGEKDAAATLAISALLQPFDAAWRAHVNAWEHWQTENIKPDRCLEEFRQDLHVAAMVLRTHNDKTYPGALVASLSIPWGNSTDDTGGYHLVWPRDLVETAGALIGFGARREARNILRYLIATQHADGRWSQNQWLGGRPRWSGIQLDEVAFPVLLASALGEDNALDGIVVTQMVERALRFIALNGPSTDQDRWEETAGINAFTLSIAIAAIVCGAEFVHLEGRRDLLLLADDWNAHIEEWLVASHPALCKEYCITQYYVRSAPSRIIADPAAMESGVPVRNHVGEHSVPASTLISTDFLQLVRFGLREPDDPVIRDSITLVDHLLKAETPRGPSWYRYNGDGYGEHEDGSPYNGTGRGHPWPLLTGERGHYALCSGELEEATQLLRAMSAMSGRCGMLPEQIWEGAPIPEFNLKPGRPTGAAMPLVWAHAEFAKLAMSLVLGRPVDRPEPVWLRYGGRKPAPERSHWSRHMPISTIRSGQSLRLIFDAATLVRWGSDNCCGTQDAVSSVDFLGLYVVDISAQDLMKASQIHISLQDLSTGRWSEEQHRIQIDPPLPFEKR